MGYPGPYECLYMTQIGLGQPPSRIKKSENPMLFYADLHDELHRAGFCEICFICY
jgi:hypothetical protein